MNKPGSNLKAEVRPANELFTTSTILRPVSTRRSVLHEVWFMWLGSLTEVTVDEGVLPNCVLMQFVPSECRSEPVPCHHIPFSRGQFGLSLPVIGTKNAQESHC